MVSREFPHPADGLAGLLLDGRDEYRAFFPLWRETLQAGFLRPADAYRHLSWADLRGIQNQYLIYALRKENLPLDDPSSYLGFVSYWIAPPGGDGRVVATTGMYFKPPARGRGWFRPFFLATLERLRGGIPIRGVKRRERTRSTRPLEMSGVVRVHRVRGVTSSANSVMRHLFETAGFRLASVEPGALPFNGSPGDALTYLLELDG
ncbi:MAG: hypothetical protein Kow0069_25500 [Promethearchaeota archaeon]